MPNVELFVYFLVTALLGMVLGRGVGRLEMAAEQSLHARRTRKTITALIAAATKLGLSSKDVVREANLVLEDEGIIIKEAE